MYDAFFVIVDCVRIDYLEVSGEKKIERRVDGAQNALAILPLKKIEHLICPLQRLEWTAYIR